MLQEDLSGPFKHLDFLRQKLYPQFDYREKEIVIRTITICYWNCFEINQSQSNASCPSSCRGVFTSTNKQQWRRLESRDYLNFWTKFRNIDKPNGTSLKQRQGADLFSKAISMFVVWNFHAAQQKFGVLSVRVQESVENQGATSTLFHHRPTEHYHIILCLLL